ncbi:MAG: porin family protein [Chryseolinea sp.]
MIVGVAAEIPLVGKMLALQPELLFHQKGFKSEDPGDGEYKEEDSNTLNYLELPVLVKVKFGKFYAIAGPSFAYGIGGKSKTTYHDLIAGTTTKSTDKIKFGKEPDNYQGDDIYVDNAFDIGVQAGVGMKISVIVIDLRYGIGMTNLLDKPSGSPYDYKSKNGSLQLTVGVPIPFGD